MSRRNQAGVREVMNCIDEIINRIEMEGRYALKSNGIEKRRNA